MFLQKIESRSQDLSTLRNQLFGNSSNDKKPQRTEKKRITSNKFITMESISTAAAKLNVCCSFVKNICNENSTMDSLPAMPGKGYAISFQNTFHSFYLEPGGNAGQNRVRLPDCNFGNSGRDKIEQKIESGHRTERTVFFF